MQGKRDKTAKPVRGAAPAGSAAAPGEAAGSADRTDPNGGAGDGCTCFRLRSLTRLAGRRYDAHLSAAGIKTTQFSLLSALLRGGPMRAADLARQLALEPSTLTRNLDPLIQAGWVEASVGNDRRTRVLSLTPAGVNQRRLARQYWLQAQLEVERLLGSDTVFSLHRLLDQCRDVLEDGSEAGTGGAAASSPASAASPPSSLSPTAAPAARPSRSRRSGAQA